MWKDDVRNAVHDGPSGQASERQLRPKHVRSSTHQTMPAEIKSRTWRGGRECTSRLPIVQSMVAYILKTALVLSSSLASMPGRVAFIAKATACAAYTYTGK